MPLNCKPRLWETRCGRQDAGHAGNGGGDGDIGHHRLAGGGIGPSGHAGGVLALRLRGHGAGAGVPGVLMSAKALEKVVPHVHA